MRRQPIFAGLVIDENDNIAETAHVGDEPCYVVDDAGFRRHITSEQVDRQIFESIAKMIEGNEGLISEQAAKMMGQEDIFTRALIANQLKQIDKQFDMLLQAGLPEESRAYMGMMGFRVRINVHGDVLEVIQPGVVDDSGEGE